jgi:hypothetical protein
MDKVGDYAGPERTVDDGRREKLRDKLVTAYSKGIIAGRVATLSQRFTSTNLDGTGKMRRPQRRNARHKPYDADRHRIRARARNRAKPPVPPLRLSNAPTATYGVASPRSDPSAPLLPFPPLDTSPRTLLAPTAACSLSASRGEPSPACDRGAADQCRRPTEPAVDASVAEHAAAAPEPAPRAGAASVLAPPSFDPEAAR